MGHPGLWSSEQWSSKILSLTSSFSGEVSEISEEAPFSCGPMEGAPSAAPGVGSRCDGHQGQQTYLVNSQNCCPPMGPSQTCECGSLMPGQPRLCDSLWSVWESEHSLSSGSVAEGLVASVILLESLSGSRQSLWGRGWSHGADSRSSSQAAEYTLVNPSEWMVCRTQGSYDMWKLSELLCLPNCGGDSSSKPRKAPVPSYFWLWQLH